MAITPGFGPGNLRSIRGTPSISNMNIFILDLDPVKAAQYQCDKHVVKMVLESCQLLCTAHRLIDGDMIVIDHYGRQRRTWKLPDQDDELSLYRPTHWYHPCSLWVRESLQNYAWTFSHFAGLLREYTHRYGKVHKCERLLSRLAHAPVKSPNIGLTPFAVAINTDVFPGVITSDIVETYRNYYRAKQDTGAVKMRWTNRPTPKFMK